MKATRLARGALAAIALAAITAPAAPAAADAKAADKAFRKGKRLLQDKRYAEACRAFEDSFREDPAIGAQLNVARCYQEWGRLTLALDAFREALRLARATDDDRAPQIRDLVKELEQDIPKLVLTLPSGRLAPSGLTITLDGADVPLSQLGEPLPVDPGGHKVTTKSDGVDQQVSTVFTSTGRRTSLTLPIDAPKAEPADAEDEPKAKVNAKARATDEAEEPEEPEEDSGEPSSPDPGRMRRLLGLGVGGAGVVGIGVATLVALDARGDYNSAFDAHCDSGTKQCDAEGLSLTSSARSQANVATAVGGLALVAVAAGAVLYFTAPSAERSSRQARYVSPLVWDGGVGLVVGGAL